MSTAVNAAIATKRKANELKEVFSEVEDPRSRKPIHDLSDLIFIAICAAVCGCDSWTDVAKFGNQKESWFRKFLSLENGVPSHDTFSRVFAAVNPDQMCEALTSWLMALGCYNDSQQIAIDGKALRCSFDNQESRSMLNLVSAWSTDSGICFGQKSVADGSNEITAVPELLDLIEVNGATITMDAMHCQEKTAKKIVAKGGDYVISVKANQSTLHDEIQEAFIAAEESEAASKRAKLRTKTEASDKRGNTSSRSIKRVCSVMPAPSIIRQLFPGVQSIVRMYREQTRQQPDGSQRETERVTF